MMPMRAFDGVEVVKLGVGIDTEGVD